MKKRLSKSHSVPEGLPRIPNGQNVAQRRKQEDKFRHHSASGINPWGPGRDGNSISLTAVIRPTHDVSDTRSVLTPFPMVRSSTFDRYSIKPYTPPMLTILQTEYEVDPALSLKQSNEHIPYGPADEHSDISSESGLFFREDLSQDCESPITTRHCIGTGLDGIPNNGATKNTRANTLTERQGLYHHQKEMRVRRRPPRTPMVSPTGLGTGPGVSGFSSMVEDDLQGTIPFKTEHFYASWDDDTASDDVPSVVTCPVLTTEMLSSDPMHGHAMRKQDRVFDWLAGCDNDVRTTSLPPHLPDINSLKRYNTTVA